MPLDPGPNGRLRCFKTAVAMVFSLTPKAAPSAVFILSCSGPVCQPSCLFRSFFRPAGGQLEEAGERQLEPGQQLSLVRLFRPEHPAPGPPALAREDGQRPLEAVDDPVLAY